MKLSEIVRRYREEHGLSIRQFAKQCGISHTAIANVESETNSYGEPYIPQLGTVLCGAGQVGPVRCILACRVAILKCPRRTGPGARRVEGSRQFRAEKEQTPGNFVTL